MIFAPPGIDGSITEVIASVIKSTLNRLAILGPEVINSKTKIAAPIQGPLDIGAKIPAAREVIKDRAKYGV